MLSLDTPPVGRKQSPVAMAVRVIVLAAFFVAAVQVPALAAWKDLQVINHTGYTIKKLYVSQSGSDSWGQDLLGSNTLQNGSTTNIRYNGDFTYYDLKIVFMNDSHREWTGNQRLNFNGAWRITIYHSRTDGDGTMIFAVSKN